MHEDSIFRQQSLYSLRFDYTCQFLQMPILRLAILSRLSLSPIRWSLANISSF